MLIKFNNVGVSEMKALKQTTDYLFLQQTNCDVRFYFEDGQLAHRRQCQHPFSQKSRVRRNVQPRHARGQAVQQQQKYQKQALLLLKLTFLRLHRRYDSQRHFQQHLNVKVSKENLKNKTRNCKEIKRNK
jgi:hypothetical protein